MVQAAVIGWKLDRILLAIYLLALLGLLLLPIVRTEYRIIGIGIDKWMHVALFGGLAVILRWNISANRHAILKSVGAAAVVAAAAEVAQGLVGYRSAELWDLLAGVLGATIGGLGMNRLVSSRVSDKLVGLVVAVLGLMVGAIFALADIIGMSKNDLFGTLQMAGTVLGALVTAGGVGICVRGWHGNSPLSGRADHH
jgi:hypothetical protein